MKIAITTSSFGKFDSSVFMERQAVDNLRQGLMAL